MYTRASCPIPRSWAEMNDLHHFTDLISGVERLVYRKTGGMLRGTTPEGLMREKRSATPFAAPATRSPTSGLYAKNEMSKDNSRAMTLRLSECCCTCSIAIRALTLSDRTVNLPLAFYKSLPTPLTQLRLRRPRKPVVWKNYLLQ